MKDEKICRLAKPVRGGILRLVFSRFLIIVLLLVLQVGIQKVLGYAKPITADNMTRNGIIACIANLAALTCGMAVWPMTFKWFSRLGDKAKA